MGNHAQESEDKYGLSPSWSRANDYKRPFDYTLKDSGQTVLLRRLDMGDLLKLGIAEELDFMSKELVTNEDANVEGDSKKQEEAQAALVDAVTKGENFGRMNDMINKVVLAGILQPKVYAVPRDEAARQKGLTYIDSVPFNDRIELFSVIFETEGLSTFRQEQEVGVGNVEHEPVLSLSADGPVALRSDDS